MTSPFLERPESSYVASNSLAFAIRDGFPVSQGHTLIVPFRQVATWFEATPEERLAIMELVEVVRRDLDEELQPDGYNVGFNAGAAAGQTVFHLHVHVIPRFHGDVADPRGGVRHVIPEMANYLLGPGDQRVTYDPVAVPARLVDGDIDPLLRHLREALRISNSVDICVAFVLRNGLSALQDDLAEFINDGGRFRIVCGDYLGVTDPVALRTLMDLSAQASGQVDARVYETDRRKGFHPKAYIFDADSPTGRAFVGSSNLSGAALRTSVEWNYRVVQASETTGFLSVRRAFERLLSNARVVPLTHAWIDEYERRRAAAPPPPLADVETEPPADPPRVNDVQAEALDALELSRDDGNAAGLVVLATGVGKTWLAAFDSAPFSRVLFVAHRSEILAQAIRTFRRIRPEARLGYYTGAEKAADAQVLFASVQALSKPENLKRFEPDQFDYIVVDEFHHAAAESYRRLISYFEPRFLLGLTATPERADGGNLLALCQENVVYECDVAEAIQRGLLCPFHYFGVPDSVNYSNIPWRRGGRFDVEELTHHVATRARAQNALEQYRDKAGDMTLGFCCSTAHADFMAEFFRAAGLRTAAVHSGAASAPRTESLELLQAGELDIVFAVDMFNEGVDLPGVDTILMLRPTESRVVWIQQFGRGLRKSDHKAHLVVIDYVGNHRTFLSPLETLLGITGGPWEVRAAIAALRTAGGRQELPAGCSVTYDLEALDLLEQVARISKRGEEFAAWAQGFLDSRGGRPTATEAYHGGFDPQEKLPKSMRPWFAGLARVGLLAERHLAVLADDAAARFLTAVQKTKMTKSYTMVVLLAWLDSGRFPAPVGVDRLVSDFARIARRAGPVAVDVTCDLDDLPALRRLIIENPIRAWTGTKSGVGDLLSFESGQLGFAPGGPADAPEGFTDLVRELAEFRLAKHLYRRRRERVQTVYQDDGLGLDAHFTTERAADGERYAVILESRGGTAGTDRVWNSQYNVGLRILLERLGALGGRLDSVELATRKVSGEEVALRRHRYPVDLRAISDFEDLRKDIQAGQGNNPTRRIRLVVQGLPSRSAATLLRRLAKGGTPRFRGRPG